MVSAVGAMQSGRHGKDHGTEVGGSRPCKERKDGAPHVSEWNAGKGRATRLEMSETCLRSSTTRLATNPAGYSDSICDGTCGSKHSLAELSAPGIL
jgi:hypothetical protein